MESQLHRRNYDDYLHPTGAHQDEAHAVNASPVVRSGLAEPTVMGTPVLVEDLYATHSDILDPPVRSLAQWEDEERRGAPPPLSTAYETHLTDLPHGGHHTYGDREQLKGSIGKHTFFEEERVPPLSTGYENLADPFRVGDYGYGQDVNQLKGSIGNPTGLLVDEEEFGAPPPSSTGIYGDEDLDRNEWVGTKKPTGIKEDTSVPNPTTGGSQANFHSTDTGGKEVGITDVLHSFDKMKIFNEHTKSPEPDQPEPEVYTGSHDQFVLEPVETPPLDTIAANLSNPNSSYTQRISSSTSALADKAAAVKDSIVSKLSSSGENKTDASKSKTKTSFPTALSHKVADTLSGTLGPVYEKVAGAGSSMATKMQGTGGEDTANSPKTKREGKGVGVKEYLVDTFKPGDDDKVLSEVITHAFHRGKASRPQLQASSTTTTYEVEVMRDEGEGERRLQESGN